MSRVNEKIDFVVTWLDSSDEEWQRQYIRYKENSTGRTESARFRNMDIFRYWFRAVEQYAPWVNKVFLVTNGTFPKWINPNHPQLVLVSHSDYIPAELLPTFNSRTIELFIHRIKGLSEHFVYFNDDVFLNAPVKPEFYFHQGLPCDNNAETVFNVPRYNKKDKFGIYMSILANIGVINAHFSRRETAKQSFRRWFGPHLGMKSLLLSLCLSHQRRFVGFNWRHFEQPYLKSTFEEAWKEESDMLLSSCTRFRGEVTLTPYFFRYWQFATNRFYPIKLKKNKGFSLSISKLEQIKAVLNNPKIFSICLNDTANCSEEEFEIINQKMHVLFEKKFISKSSFEI